MYAMYGQSITPIGGNASKTKLKQKKKILFSQSIDSALISFAKQNKVYYPFSAKPTEAMHLF